MDWVDVSQLRSDEAVLGKGEGFLRHHLMRHRLAATWAMMHSAGLGRLGAKSLGWL